MTDNLGPWVPLLHCVTVCLLTSGVQLASGLLVYSYHLANSKYLSNKMCVSVYINVQHLVTISFLKTIFRSEFLIHLGRILNYKMSFRHVLLLYPQTTEALSRFHYLRFLSGIFICKQFQAASILEPLPPRSEGGVLSSQTLQEWVNSRMYIAILAYLQER